MTCVYLGIGSNDHPQENIILAIDELRQSFRNTEISPIYKNKAIGFTGEDFLNLVVKFNTSIEIKDIIKIIERIHKLSDPLMRPESL